MIIPMKRWGQMGVTQGTDEVFAAAPIPSQSELAGVRGEAHVIGEEVNWKKAAVFGVDGFIVQVEDPDNSISVDTLWDNRVPKAKDVGSLGALGLGTVALGAGPTFEPGEMAPEALIDAGGYKPVHMFTHRDLITIVDNPNGYNFVAADASAYFPTAKVKINVERRYQVGGHPSMAMFAFSSPTLDGLTSTIWNAPDESEWGILKYLRRLLEDAFVRFINITEAGAESPCEQVAQTMGGYVTPPICQGAALSWDPMTYNVWARTTFLVDVPGRVTMRAIKSEV